MAGTTHNLSAIQQIILANFLSGGVASTSEITESLRHMGRKAVQDAMLGLAEMGIAALHYHDWPHSLTARERRMMVSQTIAPEAAKYHACWTNGKEYYVGIALR